MSGIWVDSSLPAIAQTPLCPTTSRSRISPPRRPAAARSTTVRRRMRSNHLLNQPPCRRG